MNQKCKIIIFSDIHYLDVGTEPRNKRKITKLAIPILNKLIDEINNKYKPDVSIHLGDLIQDDRNHNKDLENIKYVCEQLKNIKFPFYSIIGNHDLATMESRREVEEVLGYEHSTFSVNINGYHLILLGSDVEINIGDINGGVNKTRFISKEDLEWLQKDLQENKLPCIIFSHFGIAEDNMKGNYWFEERPEQALFENRKELKQIIKENNNIIAVFSGHQHWTKKINEDEINYYLLGSLVEDINSNGIPDGVYFEVNLENEKIDVVEHHIVI